MTGAQEIMDAVWAIYRSRVEPSVGPERVGQFVVIDVDSGDFEIDPDEIAASDRLKARHPLGKRGLIRIGYRTAHRIGAFPKRDRG